MAALEKNAPSGEGVKWRFPSVHPEGRKFALISAGITGLVAVIGWGTLAWLMLGVTAWVLAFFRDPIRTTPRNERYVISPADGMVTLIQCVTAPKELVAEMGEGRFTRVSIFMSVFDVHINRTPIAGTIKQVVYVAGKFLNADLDKASEDNERQHFVVERSDGVKIGFTQIAGLVARRGSAAHPVIVGFAAETGDESGSVLDLARAKLARKGCDLLVANEVGATKTFGQDTNTVHLLFRDGRPGVTVGPASKAAVADAVWDGIRDLIPASH